MIKVICNEVETNRALSEAGQKCPEYTPLYVEVSGELSLARVVRVELRTEKYGEVEKEIMVLVTDFEQQYPEADFSCMGC